MHVAHQQLRDRAGAAEIALDHRIFDRAGHTHQIHAVMLRKALVFHGHEGIPHVLGKRPQRDVDAALFTEFADERAVATQYQRGLCRRDNLPRLSGGARRALCRHGARHEG